MKNICTKSIKLKETITNIKMDPKGCLKKHLTQETCLKAGIIMILLFCIISQIPFLVEHTLSFFAPKHFYSGVAYDHIRPAVLFIFSAYHVVAYVVFGHVIIAKSRDKKAEIFALLTMILLFCGKAARYSMYFGYALTTSDNYGFIIGRIVMLSATALVILDFINNIVIIHMKPTGLRSALVGIGIFAGIACMVTFTILDGGSFDSFYYYPDGGYIFELRMFEMTSWAVVLTILAVGILFPLLVCTESNKKQGEIEEQLPAVS